jgi:hypothetical protein
MGTTLRVDRLGLGCIEVQLYFAKGLGRPWPSFARAAPVLSRKTWELLCSASKRELGTLRSQERQVGPAQVATTSLFYFIFMYFSVFFYEI